MTSKSIIKKPDLVMRSSVEDLEIIPKQQIIFQKHGNPNTDNQVQNKKSVNKHVLSSIEELLQKNPFVSEEDLRFTHSQEDMFFVWAKHIGVNSSLAMIRSENLPEVDFADDHPNTYCLISKEKDNTDNRKKRNIILKMYKEFVKNNDTFENKTINKLATGIKIQELSEVSLKFLLYSNPDSLAFYFTHLEGEFYRVWINEYHMLDLLEFIHQTNIKRTLGIIKKDAILNAEETNIPFTLMIKRESVPL